MPTLAEIEAGRPKSVDLPRPTAWPMVMAFGITLLFAGLVTSLAVSGVGAEAHSYFQSGSSGCLKSHRGRRLRTTGSFAKL